MIRTLDGHARAFLSDRYQRIDNFDVAEAVLPVLMEEEGLQIVSTEVTENKLYINAVTERLRADVKVGDPVQAGVRISNSEIGKGAFNVEPLVYRLVCLNGMVSNFAKFGRHHVGARADVNETVYELLSDETLAADDKAVLLKARDVVKASLSESLFQQQVTKLQESTERKVDNPVKAVEVLTQKTSLTEGESQSVLKHLIEGGDVSQWGIANAVTRTAQDVESFDRSAELEVIGGKIIDLPVTDWSQIAEAA